MTTPVHDRPRRTEPTPMPTPALRLVEPLPPGGGADGPAALLAASGRRGRVPDLGARPARALALLALRAIEGGTIVVREHGQEQVIRGRSADPYGRHHLDAVLEVHDPRFYVAVATRGSSGLGEAYRRGWFDADDLPALLRLLARAARRADPARQRLHRLTAPLLDPVRRRRGPDAHRDRQHIAAHYDLGNAFFELFLDETLTYSSGIFTGPETPMVDASLAKIDRLCRRLDLRPGQRIVEIGTGWGAFAIHAAANYGVDVVTTTLSAEQHRTATQRVAAAGLADRIDVRLDHFRDLRGTFDALVAVEMIEAVHWRELGDFLERCGRLVAPTGAVALQAIVTAPARHHVARTANDFIKSHVFPGSSIPSVPSILEAAAAHTDLLPADLSDFGLHYAETLRRWRAALEERRSEARSLGLDDSFLRLWEFYLSYCEAGFEERWVSVVQLVLERPGRSPSLQDREEAVGRQAG